MFSFIAKFFGLLLEWLYNMVGGNYGVAMVLFAIALRIILLPITIKQHKSMTKMSKIQGKIQSVQFKYKNNPEQMNKEIMELYKKEKVSPFSGCLSSIIPMLILISVFMVVSKPLTYMKRTDNQVIEQYKQEVLGENAKDSYYEIRIIQEKAKQDDRVNIDMNFLGLDLSMVPNKNLNNYKVYIIPLLYVISSVLSIKYTTSLQSKKKKNDEEKSLETKSTEQMGKSMMYIMPVMALSIAFIAPLGLALYWLVSNVLMIVEKLVLNKVFKEEVEDSKED